MNTSDIAPISSAERPSRPSQFFMSSGVHDSTPGLRARAFSITFFSFSDVSPSSSGSIPSSWLLYASAIASSWKDSTDTATSFILAWYSSAAFAAVSSNSSCVIAPSESIRLLVLNTLFSALYACSDADAA